MKPFFRALYCRPKWPCGMTSHGQWCLSTRASDSRVWRLIGGRHKKGYFMKIFKLGVILWKTWWKRLFVWNFTFFSPSWSAYADAGLGPRQPANWHDTGCATNKCVQDIQQVRMVLTPEFSSDPVLCWLHAVRVLVWVKTRGLKSLECLLQTCFWWFC